MNSRDISTTPPRGVGALKRSVRVEQAFALSLGLLILCCSLGAGKLYPFEAPSFFVARADQYCRYTLRDPQQRELPMYEFGLGDFYAGQGGYAVGVPGQEPGAIKLPATINVYGEVPAPSEVAGVVQRALRARSEPEYVIVDQQVIGPLDQEAVGVVASHRMRVSRNGVDVER
jgi:hypothetical protein